MFRAAILPALVTSSLLPLLAQEPRPLPSLAEATRIHDSKADAARTWPELLDALAKCDAVFLGETHVDDTTHQVELYVLEQLLARRPGKVVLSMEMFERDVQPALDDYLAGRADEATFLQKARPWGNYATAYRPLVEAAKAAQIPVVAANFPVPLRRALAGDDPKGAIARLTEAQRAWMPAEIFPASDRYWERVDRAVRGHMGGGGGGSAAERLYDTQNLWDNAMGDAVAKAKAAYPDSLVLHVAGGFHVAYRDGTVAQFVLRSTASTFAVVEIAATSELHFARPDRDRAQADYVVYSRTLSREENDGTWAVEVPAELRYELDVPKIGANWPLLVWLPDRTSRPEDALAYWRATVGGEAAIAVVHQPFPELQDDLALGGRYAFGDGFRADYTRVSQSLARIVEYATRKFAIDRRRVVIASRGDGGAAVLWTALYGEWLDADFVAVDPGDLARLAMESLPDQQPVARSLRLFATDGSWRQRLEQVAADYTKVGTKAAVAPLGGPGELAAHVRESLGLPPRAQRDAVPAHEFVLPQDGPRAREWAELVESVWQRDGKVTAGIRTAPRTAADPGIVDHLLAVGGDGEWPAASFADGKGIPLAGGPFGGTTVVVLPKGTSDADRATWLQHEQNKVLKRRSMFANIAVACADGEPSLPSVVGSLRQKGRMRFLIVPVVFCADAATMHALKAQLGTAAEGLDVCWLPGLGAELAAR
jgi:uncharacterized iron-regulated protein